MSLVLLVVFFLLTNAIFTKVLISLPEYFVNQGAMVGRFAILGLIVLFLGWTMGDD
ncbi:hypothetical protein IQE94_09190 [Synechocystis sp. PCC 7339]|uniref:hypothetical protein n=1 Tax=unclassified Synechocystis TaxID=2640012 RepID=UPI001BAF23D0|nr:MULTISPECIES: hypothetical protein [unclassified Synechocystis]QUS62180.1 hypothetical protein HTZ78_16955 [Synechocystis sp. PCC 7338]UAJ71363.1 hypothetical protein IQE94_09190 [Synechocystis sp. PCC 7339]